VETEPLDFPENKDLTDENEPISDISAADQSFVVASEPAENIPHAQFELPVSNVAFPEPHPLLPEYAETAAPDISNDRPSEQPLAPSNAIENQWRSEDVSFEEPFAALPYTPQTPDENIRRSGLAWSAGIAFFGSVSFTLFLGWLIDLILGISPWGIVAGIVLGSVIGFIQFFRISSQIFSPKTSRSDIRSLMSDDQSDE